MYKGAWIPTKAYKTGKACLFQDSATEWLFKQYLVSCMIRLHGLKTSFQKVFPSLFEENCKTVELFISTYIQIAAYPLAALHSCWISTRFLTEEKSPQPLLKMFSFLVLLKVKISGCRLFFYSFDLNCSDIDLNAHNLVHRTYKPQKMVPDLGQTTLNCELDLFCFISMNVLDKHVFKTCRHIIIPFRNFTCVIHNVTLL